MVLCAIISFTAAKAAEARCCIVSAPFVWYGAYKKRKNNATARGKYAVAAMACTVPAPFGEEVNKARK